MTRPDPLLDRPSWVPRWLSVDDVRAMRWLRRVVGGVFFLALAACVVEGADSPADPELGEAPAGTDAGASTTDDPGDPGDRETTGLAARFGTVLVELMTASGEVLELCLLDADEPAERGRGLMEVTDLEGHDGMVFRFGDQDVESNFVMVDTVTPLTISWWAADGSLVSTTDMTPCTEDDDADCERYGAAGPYRYAVEVFEGTLPEAAPGARLEVTGRSCQTS